MMERQPLRRGLQLTFARPWLWWIPVAVDLAKWALGLLLLRWGFYWAELDFGAAYQLHQGQHVVYAGLPCALPSVAGIGYHLAPVGSDNGGWLQWAVLAILFAFNAALRSGYLNLLNARVHEAPVTLQTFGRGIRRFGLRVAGLNLVWLGLAAGAIYLLAGWWLDVVILGILLVLMAWFDLAQFVMVTADAGILRGLLGVPLLVGQQAPFIASVLLLSLLLTGGLSSLLYTLHLTSPLWGILPNSVVGTWLTLSLLGALPAANYGSRLLRGSKRNYKGMTSGCDLGSQPP